ncbi:MAG TPA: dTMP kinase [Chthonomonadaceae bacterium]|nr:dTMP kinase [Chthonomonadaceae bacterium]
MEKVSPGTGLFVTFEGIEGAGKTTQVAMLCAALVQEGWKVCVTREPGGDPIAEAVRDLVLHESMSARAELLLFLATRAENVERIIRPKLDEGAIVLCDRFSDSTMAYQVAARGLDRDIVGRLNAFAAHELVPDLTFLLDLPRKSVCLVSMRVIAWRPKVSSSTSASGRDIWPKRRIIPLGSSLSMRRRRSTRCTRPFTPTSSAPSPIFTA